MAAISLPLNDRCDVKPINHERLYHTFQLCEGSIDKENRKLYEIVFQIKIVTNQCFCFYALHELLSTRSVKELIKTLQHSEKTLQLLTVKITPNTGV